MASTNRTTASSPEPTPGPPKAAAASRALPAPSRAELACAFAQALDLGEGRQPGHAARICYTALHLAQALGLPDGECRAVFYAALLHDAGAVPASAEICRLLNVGEEAFFAAQPGRSPQEIALDIAPENASSVVNVFHAHAKRGADIARDLGFDPAVQAAIAAHHERWDGQGYPNALEGADIPIAARLVAAADLIESLISTDINPLVARRNLVSALREHAAGALDTKLAQEALKLAQSDAFWLGLHNYELSEELPASYPEDPAQEERSPLDLQTFATVFAALADAKGEYTARHSVRTAEIADQLAEAVGFRQARRELLHIAAVARDVGLLGVPARIIAKPDILSLTEMEAMRKHPTHSQMVFEALPGLEEVASWVGGHHERLDGRGYPETLEGEAIPLEARLIAVADTYVALTSTRPYRPALSDEDAQQVLLGGAEKQLDPKLVDVLCSRVLQATSSRTARRSRRRR